MEKLLVTEALDERDLLKKRIVSAIQCSALVSTMTPSDKKTASGLSLEAFEKEARASMQKITDLIDRYERLDSAILLANATEQINVAGKTMSRASAINLRKSLIGSGVTKSLDFRGMFISKLSTEINDAKMNIAKSKSLADKQRESLTFNVSSSDKKELTAEVLSGIDTYCDSLVSVIVDPVKAEDKLASLVEERESLLTHLETAIKISNATTYVEF